MLDDNFYERLIYLPIDELETCLDEKVNEFDCGDEGLNNYLKDKAIGDHNEMIGATTLIWDEQNNKIIGYYTLKNSCLFYSRSNDEINRMAIPSLEVVMFSIHKEYQNNGIGSEILKSLIYEVTDYSLSFSSAKAITLYALNNKNCIGFYEKLSFDKLDDYMGLVYDACRNKTVPMYLRIG